MKFFYNVSRLERAINMEDVHIGNPHREGEDLLLDVDVLATTFRRPAEGTPQAAGGPPGAAQPARAGKPGGAR